MDNLIAEKKARPMLIVMVKGYRDALEKGGIRTVFYESPGTAHEWLTWRRRLREFAPRLFQPSAVPAAAAPPSAAPAAGFPMKPITGQVQRRRS